MQPKTIVTPRQMIKAVYGLRGALFSHTLVGDDSTLMDMDAPALLPAGSTMRNEPLRNHPDHHDYFVVFETLVYREPLADGSHWA